VVVPSGRENLFGTLVVLLAVAFLPRCAAADQGAVPVTGTFRVQIHGKHRVVEPHYQGEALITFDEQATMSVWSTGGDRASVTIGPFGHWNDSMRFEGVMVDGTICARWSHCSKHEARMIWGTVGPGSTCKMVITNDAPTRDLPAGYTEMTISAVQ